MRLSSVNGAARHGILDGMKAMRTILLAFLCMLAPLQQAFTQGSVAPAALTFPEVARAGGPVWAYIQIPQPYTVQYPVGIAPDDFGCNEIEVRQNGVLLPRREFIRRTGPPPPSGPPCGHIGIPRRPMTHPGRLPLHLQFELKSGVYEVRYTRRQFISPQRYEIQFQSQWTQVEIQDASPFVIGLPPQDPVEILSDYLPGILGYTDNARLSGVIESLYHPEETVRSYALYALDYWPEAEVERRLSAAVRSRGASDVIVSYMLPAVPDLVEPMTVYLGSSDFVLIRGALAAAQKVLSDRGSKPLYSEAVKAKAEEALIKSVENVMLVGDEQTRNNVASLLGSVPDPRHRDLLWGFVNRRVAVEQALIAITWHKDPADLPKLAQLLESPVAGDPLSRELSSLPYALHNAYGATALLVLERAIQNSGHVWVRTQSARQLISAGSASGFAFVAAAIEENRVYKREMTDFVRSIFPELRMSSESDILAFLKSRAR